MPLNGFNFVDNGTVKHNDLWNDGFHLLECVEIRFCR